MKKTIKSKAAKSTKRVAVKKVAKQTIKRLDPMQKIACVNSKLRLGDVPKLAAKTGVASIIINQVIEGRKDNSKVLNAAYDLTRGRKTNAQVIKDFSLRTK